LPSTQRSLSEEISPLPVSRIILTVFFASLTAASFLPLPALLHYLRHQPNPPAFTDALEHSWQRFHVLFIGTACTVYALGPWLVRVHAQLVRRWRPAYTVWLLLFGSLALSFFIVIIGRHQFGAFDFNIFLETAWRQFRGEHPYTDFYTSAPPLFNMGALWAFRLFGVSWNAGLYFTALFSVITFIWFYLLFRRLGVSAPLSLLASFAIEASSMLLLCFWWYNNSALVMGAIFFASALLYARTPDARFVQLSFVISLTLLLLAKPNIAGATAAPCCFLLFIQTPRKLRLFLLTAAGALLALVLLLSSHVTVSALLASYHGASKQRGILSAFGYYQMPPFLRHVTLLWLAILCLPFLYLLPPIHQSLRRRDWSRIAGLLLLFVGPLVAIVGIAENGEFPDVEVTLLIVAIVFILYVARFTGPNLRYLGVALLCAFIAVDSYAGAVRLRVATIGEHMFFDWGQDNDHISSGPLKDMWVTPQFTEVEQQIRSVMASNPGPIFFGPRIDFNYMALQLPSPDHFPAWWHPGTAFDAADQPAIIAHWEQQRYPTLIFYVNDSKTDYTHYPSQFRGIIMRDYVPDHTYSRLTVWHRKPGV
jgi:hypothetical protein